MKKLLFVFLGLILLNANTTFARNRTEIIKTISESFQETLHYKLTLKQIFKPEQKSLIDEKLVKLNAGFVIEDVNYEEKSVIIKLNPGIKLKEAISQFNNLLGADYSVINTTELSK